MNEDVLAAFDELDEPVATLTDIADVMDPSREAIHTRLNELVAEGELNRKQAGARAVVYWRSRDTNLVDPATSD